jgi:hypothetical protein
MKKVIAIISLLILCISIQAQTYIIRSCNKTTGYYSEKTHGWVETCAPAPNNVKITFNIDNRVVTLDNVYNDTFKLLTLVKEENGYDTSRGEPWTSQTYNALDKDGKEAVVTIQSFDSGLQFFTIDYSDVRFKYQGNLVAF